MSDRAGEYIVGLFGAEDELLATLREEADRTGLPPIAISADEGRLLQVLLTAINARRVLEVGTLGGYSAICMARALPPGGRLLSIEIEEKQHPVFAFRCGEGSVSPCMEVQHWNRQSLCSMRVCRSRPFLCL